MTLEKRTIVRPLPRRGPVALRAGFAALDRLHPALASRIATRLWFRLPTPPPPSQRLTHTPPGGRPIQLRLGEMALRGRRYGRDGDPAAFLVHGWGGWWQQLSAHVEPLVAAGYQVIAYDAPSHGASGPGAHGARTSRVMELADAYQALTDAYGPARLTVAHSMGAMAVLWAARRGTPTNSMAFVAAATSVDPMVDWFSRVAGIGPRTRAGLVAAIERALGYPLATFEAQTLAERAYRSGARPPLLAVHDTTDSSSPAIGSLQLVESWPGATLHTTEGLGHRRVLRDAGVVARITAFARGGTEDFVRATRAPVPDGVGSV